MSHTTRTLALTESWDLKLTATGRLALAEGAKATAQAVANEIRRFMFDSYFDYDLGIPHFATELGHTLPEAALRAYIRKAALRVDDVAEVTAIELDGYDRETRTLTGRVTFKTAAGQTATAEM